MNNRNPWSWLASEEAIGFNIIVARPGAFAGKPAPTGFVANTISVNNRHPCRSWLASEEAIDFNIIVG